MLGILSTSSNTTALDFNERCISTLTIYSRSSGQYCLLHLYYSYGLTTYIIVIAGNQQMRLMKRS